MPRTRGIQGIAWVLEAKFIGGGAPSIPATTRSPVIGFRTVMKRAANA